MRTNLSGHSKRQNQSGQGSGSSMQPMEALVSPACTFRIRANNSFTVTSVLDCGVLLIINHAKQRQAFTYVRRRFFSRAEIACGLAILARRRGRSPSCAPRTMPCFLASNRKLFLLHSFNLSPFQGIRAKKEWKCPETTVAEQVATTSCLLYHQSAIAKSDRVAIMSHLE